MSMIPVESVTVHAFEFADPEPYRVYGSHQQAPARALTRRRRKLSTDTTDDAARRVSAWNTVSLVGAASGSRR